MLNLGQYTQQIQGSNRWTAAALRLVEDAINRLAKNVGADATGNTMAPPKLQALQVKSAGEYVHAVITDNSVLNRGVHYFLEADTDPNFGQPHVLHLGTSRSPLTFHLPALDDNGVQQSYYLRAYSQYPGSKPSPPIVYGGIAPIAIAPAGTTRMSLIPSTGSGTAAPNGQQGGYGFGVFGTRGAQSPKRSVSAA